LFVRKLGKNPYLVACDTYRPAAIDQLEQIGRELSVPVYTEGIGPSPEEIAERGIKEARDGGYDFVIVDTAGRQVVDMEMMEEIRRVRKVSRPHSVLLVLDVVTGQNAVEVAQAFQEYADFDGMVLTKLDGDARGGAALSVVSVTGRPVKFASEGEKMGEFDYFYPDRMAGRILGMGDVLTLIEKAEQQMDQTEAEAQGKKLMSGKFTFEDFLQQMQMIKKMGPLSGLLGMIPGLNKQLKDVEIDDRQLGRVEAMITSMTLKERRNPKLLQNPSRARRIARGAGATQQDVQKLVKQFNEMQKMMRQMGKGGGMPRIPGLSGRR
jgi:signal recognition particle subunit SRP54